MKVSGALCGVKVPKLMSSNTLKKISVLHQVQSSDKIINKFSVTLQLGNKRKNNFDRIRVLYNGMHFSNILFMLL